MSIGGPDGFRFGLEAEFLLVDAASFRPLWHPDLNFEKLNTALEAIPVDDFQCEGFKTEPPQRKPGPYCGGRLSSARSADESHRSATEGGRDPHADL
jgi:hypothetical protein